MWRGGRQPRQPAPVLPPLYHQPSFVRHLDAHGVSWRWYSFDPGSLRLADVHYRLGHHDRFGYFSKTGPAVADQVRSHGQPESAQFSRRRRRRTLPSVSWIDPAFTNFNPLGFPVNDDHPPADIRDGQDLVLAVYDALASSPQWDRSLLVVVYDEHGGFFDHVPPPAADDDDPATFGSYGVRVPALIVSPWVEARRGVQHRVRSHVDHQDDPGPLLPPGPGRASPPTSPSAAGTVRCRTTQAGALCRPTISASC